jgi:hypothetical protein
MLDPAAADRAQRSAGEDSERAGIGGTTMYRSRPWFAVSDRSECTGVGARLQYLICELRVRNLMTTTTRRAR